LSDVVGFVGSEEHADIMVSVNPVIANAAARIAPAKGSFFIDGFPIGFWVADYSTHFGTHLAS